jgi:hypothetical protein
MLSRKSMKNMLDPNSKMLRAFMTTTIAIGTIVLSPVIILVAPFVLAWSISGILLEKKVDKDLDMWDEYSFDFSKFSSWKTENK